MYTAYTGQVRVTGISVAPKHLFLCWEHSVCQCERLSACCGTLVLPPAQLQLAPVSRGRRCAVWAGQEHSGLLEFSWACSLVRCRQLAGNEKQSPVSHQLPQFSEWLPVHHASHPSGALHSLFCKRVNAWSFLISPAPLLSRHPPPPIHTKCSASRVPSQPLSRAHMSHTVAKWLPFIFWVIPSPSDCSECGFPTLIIILSQQTQLAPWEL